MDLTIISRLILLVSVWMWSRDTLRHIKGRVASQKGLDTESSLAFPWITGRSKLSDLRSTFGMECLWEVGATRRIGYAKDYHSGNPCRLRVRQCLEVGTMTGFANNWFRGSRRILSCWIECQIGRVNVNSVTMVRTMLLGVEDKGGESQSVDEERREPDRIVPVVTAWKKDSDGASRIRGIDTRLGGFHVQLSL